MLKKIYMSHNISERIMSGFIKMNREKYRPSFVHVLPMTVAVVVWWYTLGIS